MAFSVNEEDNLIELTSVPSLHQIVKGRQDFQILTINLEEEEIILLCQSFGYAQ